MDCWVKSGNAFIPKNVGACLAKLNETTRIDFQIIFFTMFRQIWQNWYSLLEQRMISKMIFLWKSLEQERNV